MHIAKRLLVALALPLALMAAPGSAAATDNGTSADRCVDTSLYMSNGRVIQATMWNVCDFTLNQVDAHLFNGPAGIDKRSARYNVPPGGGISFNMGPNGYLPPKGSLSCGELWGPGAYFWGRDCIAH